MEAIKECLVKFIDKPHDDELNFKLAYSYDIEKQYATAYSYYLRCAEYTDNDIFAAESLIRCSLCINKQKNRDEKELYLIKHAITASPYSIEPYYIASLYFSWRSGNAPEKRLWLDSYMYACMGINLLENNLETGSFKYDIGYSKENIYYQKAYAGKNIGKIDEARDIYTRILTSFDISDSTRKFITLKKNELPEPSHDIIKYSNKKINSLKFNFERCNKIENNYSQIYQDMFVLSMNNGKNSGTYLEIGAGDYKYGNNTYLLEYHFNWSGVSIDINNSCVEGFNNVRKNKCLCADATKIDYIKLLNENFKSTNIDYLQLDCDPPNITFDILTKIPFDKYKFGVITYEHDHYNDNTGKYREKSREFLKEMGYKLIAGNISSYKDRCPFEDWWVHPDLIDENVYKLFERDEDIPINGEKYMFNKQKYNNIVLDVEENLKNTNVENIWKKNEYIIDNKDENEKTPLLSNNILEKKTKPDGSFVFIKVSKCGTETVRLLIKESENDKNSILDCAYEDIFRYNNRQFKYSVHHINYDTYFTNHLNNIMIHPIKYIGFVRNPINRLISHYNYTNRYSSKLSFDEWYQKFYNTNAGWWGGCNNSINSLDVTNNFMSRYLGFNSIEEINEDNIKSRYHFIVVLEDPDKYTKLANILNINYSNVKVANKNKSYNRDKVIISKKTKELFDENNKMDNKLYELVCKIYSPKIINSFILNNELECKIYSPKIVDCFIFYNELDLLNYRLNLLDDYVDNFILVEATHTHTGKEKKLFYNENKELFQKFKDKIIHVIVDDFPCKYADIEKNEQWKNENFQRNCIKRGIDKLLLNDKDIITICDLDEIPNPEILKEIKDNKKQIIKSSLKMDMYYYNLNCKININVWISPKLISYNELNKLDITIHEFRCKKTDNIIENGGWHLSFFGDKDFIENKIKNYGHQEYNNDEILSNIEEKIKLNKDLFNRKNHDIQYINIENNENLPPKYEIYLQKYFSLEIKEEGDNIKDFYYYIPCHDQLGNDIYRMNSSNIENMLREVYKNPDSIAVNTQGYVKNKVDRIKQINNWWYPKDGIYIKKTKASEKDYSKLIPVFGTLVCTTTKWIKKQLDSIDYPIENFIIINNNPDLLTRELDGLVKKSYKFIEKLKVYHMPYNLGCAEGWNLIIKSFMFSPYWIICNDDVSFTPGLLEEMNIAAQDKEVGMVHHKPIYLPHLKKFGTFELFLIKDWIVEKYGFFDTNFYPAYYEDIDYIFRLMDEPIKIVNKINKKLYHGDTNNYNISGKNTLKSDEKVNIRLKVAKYNNLNYFLKKWNCSNPEHIDIEKKYKYPFNKNEYTTYDFNLKSAKNNHLLDTLKNIPKTNISEKIPFSIKKIPNLIVIDNFYENPDEIREYALKLDYKNPENHGVVGYRSQSGRKILDGTKEIFEKLLYKSIPNGTNVGEWDYLTNGCFHWCNASVPIVYHSDSQQYAGIIYLTPDAPPNTGTSFFRHKKYKLRNSEIFSKSDWYESDLKYKEPHLDKTQWEIVDSIGNVYNRLVIFNAQQIHGVTEYFGEDINNSRLFQLFFFNLENSNKE